MAAGTAFFSELLNEKPALLRQIIAFNLAVREDDAGGLDPIWAAAAAQDKGLRRALAALRGGEQGEAGFWDFVDEASRLALFDAASLERLGKFAAAGVFGGEIALAIERPRREALKRALGADACAYAVARGRWQAGSLAAPLLLMTPEGALEERTLALARLLLEAAALRWPEALRALAAGKLQALSLPALALPPEAAAGDMPLRIWRYLKKIILREMDPSWAMFFD